MCIGEYYTAHCDENTIFLNRGPIRPEQSLRIFQIKTKMIKI